MGLILVPTPLGNLRDITLRALDVLRDCDLLVAEDTRVAMRLLQALDLPAKTIWSYREQNAQAITGAILERAAVGTVAVTTDAGMPGIADPGQWLVAAARARGIRVDILPGPCAFVCAAVLSGFDLRGLSFEGFVPRARGERERVFTAARARGATTVWYESPNRIVASLETLAAIAPDTAVFVVREFTKRYEQQLHGSPEAVANQLVRSPRGEFSLVLAGTGVVTAAQWEAGSDVDAEIDRALSDGSSLPDIVRDLTRRGAGTRADLYRRAIARRAEQQRT